MREQRIFSSPAVMPLRGRSMSIAYDLSATRKSLAEQGTCEAPVGKHVKLIIACGVLSLLTNFPEGYCDSYPNTSHRTFQNQINESYIERGLEGGLSEIVFTWYWSLMLNIWFVGFFIGTFLTPYCCDNLGRKKSLHIANCVAFVGAILSYIGVTYHIPELFFFSRLVISTSSGLSFGSLILFLQEVTPTELRGVTSFLNESTVLLTMCLGIGFGMDAIFGKNLRMLTGISIVPALLSMIVVAPLHESPKHLLLNRDDRKAAIDSLEFYRGKSVKNEEVLEEMMREKEIIDMDDEHAKASIWQGVKEVFSLPHLRIAFFLGAASLQIVVGIWPLVYLSTDLLEENFSREISQWATFVFMLADFIASICGLTIIEKFGRRTLLIGLGVANVISLCLYIISDLLIPVWEPIRWGQIVALILFGVTYGVALGPIATFITSELVPQRSRSIVQSMVLGFNTFMCFVLSFITLPLYTWIGAWSFLPLLVIPSIFCLIFLYLCLPETRGREVHDVVEELIKRHNTGGVGYNVHDISYSVQSTASISTRGSINV